MSFNDFLPTLSQSASPNLLLISAVWSPPAATSQVWRAPNVYQRWPVHVVGPSPAPYFPDLVMTFIWKCPQLPWDSTWLFLCVLPACQLKFHVLWYSEEDLKLALKILFSARTNEGCKWGLCQTLVSVHILLRWAGLWPKSLSISQLLAGDEGS